MGGTYREEQGGQGQGADAGGERLIVPFLSFCFREHEPTEDAGGERDA